MGIKFFQHLLIPRAQFRVSNVVRPRLQAVRYAAPASPNAIRWIDPDDVRHYNLDITYGRGLGRIEVGEWDVESKPLDEHRTYRVHTQRFADRLEWQETEYPPKGAELRAKWDDRVDFIETKCEYVDELYTEIREHGYVPNFVESGEAPPREQVPTRDLEPMICIGRDGRLILHEGFHRVTIAKLLEIDRIPVYVVTRHAKWQEIRDEIASANSIDTLTDRVRSNLDHLDLRGLVEPLEVD